MEYGLRRYEAAQRLFWVLFFILCLGLAYLLAEAAMDSPAAPKAVPPTLHPDALKSLSFWFQLQWIRGEPFGKVLVYLLYVAMIFVVGRFFWLLVQYVGKFYVMSLLDSHIRKPAGPPKRGLDPLSMNPEKLFPTEILLKKTAPLYLRLLFHPLTRLRLMLARNQGTLSSEELMERERRIVETDWQILWGAWTPFRWLLWLLPFFAMLQSAWLLYQQVQPAVTGQKEIHDILAPVFASIIPLVQVVLITVLLSLGSGLLKRMEGFYLSGVDTLFYDQFLSRLPFQSSDTVILLEALNRHFQELHFVLRRLEKSLGEGK